MVRICSGLLTPASRQSYFLHNGFENRSVVFQLHPGELEQSIRRQRKVTMCIVQTERQAVLSRQMHFNPPRAHHLQTALSSVKISESVGKFTECGDRNQGIARIKCTNTDCKIDYFRLFSCIQWYHCLFFINLFDKYSFRDYK